MFSKSSKESDIWGWIQFATSYLSKRRPAERQHISEITHTGTQNKARQAFIRIQSNGLNSLTTTQTDTETMMARVLKEWGNKVRFFWRWCMLAHICTNPRIYSECGKTSVSLQTQSSHNQTTSHNKVQTAAPFWCRVQDQNFPGNRFFPQYVVC